MKAHAGDERRRGEKPEGPPSSLWLQSCLWQGLHLLRGRSSPLGSGDTTSSFVPSDRRGSGFPPQRIPGWPRRLPGALSAVPPRPSPCSKFQAWALSSCLDPSETMAFLLLAWTFRLALSTVPCKDPRCPCTFPQDLPPLLRPGQPRAVLASDSWKGHFFTQQAQPWSRSPRSHGANSLLPP